MAPSNNAVHTEQIVRDITGSILCSSETAPKIGLVAHFNLSLVAHFNFGLSARFNFGLIA